MQLKRYQCSDVREAFRRIRDELGPDAVIVATRELPETRAGRHGRPLIEVVAAVDREPGIPDAHDVDALLLAREANKQGVGGTTDLSWLVDVLRENGLDERTASSVAASAAWRAGEGASREALRPAVAETLMARTRVSEPPWRGRGAKVAVFVGSAGSGKTTTLAKVAAYAAFQENQRVAIVTTDTDRPGSTARLEAMAKVMDLPLFQVGQPWQLKATLAKLTGYDRVLVDTPPPSGASGETDETLRAVLKMCPGARYLCAEAHTATRNLLKIGRRFADLGVDALVATKVDEAYSCGGIFALQQTVDLPLALLCTGPRVPEDVEVARADVFCNRILSPNPGEAREGCSDGRSKHVA